MSSYTVSYTASHTPALNLTAGKPTTTRAAGSHATAMRAGRLRLTRRGRVVVTTLVAVPLVAAAAFFGLSAQGALASGTTSTTHFHYVTIQPGQSLWQVAQTVAPSADPRDVITAIVSLNQLQSVDVTPGQRIAIPDDY